MRARLREHLERLLRAERDRTADALRRSEADLAATTLGLGSVGTAVAEADADVNVAVRASAHLAEIDEALRLLDTNPDAFERCARCGRRIERKRLELVTWSRLCVTCAERAASYRPNHHQ